MLDGGPRRVPRPVDRRPAAPRTPESVRREVEASEYPEPAPTRAARPAAAQSPSNDPPKLQKRLPWRTISVIIGILLLVAAGWYLYPSVRGNDMPGVDSSKYQAVFLAGGQVYFGKLEPVSAGYMKLKQVFYINSGSSDAKDSDLEAADGANMQLIKLGDEVHSPEDEMIINRDQVLFVENLKSDGRVAELIDNYREEKK